LRSLRFTIRQKIIALLAFCAAGLIWILEQIWGDAIVSFVKSFIPYPYMFTSAIEWGINHPGELSLLLFFGSSVYLVFQIIKQTRPVKNMPISLASSEAAYLNNGGISITNHTGEDLTNCTIQIERVNGNDVEKQLLHWADDFIDSIDIPNGGKGNVFLHQLFHQIKERIENNMFVFPNAAKEAELFFRGNTRTGETRSMTIFVLIKGRAVENEPSITSYRAIIEKIETTSPEFG
jgi:phage terminase large subunit-like protein